MPDTDDPTTELPERRRDTTTRVDITASWGKLITTIGVPSAIALFLVWQQSVRVENLMIDAANEARMTRAAVEAHAGTTGPLNVYMERMVNLQLQQCINSADDYLKRNRCFDALYQTPTRPGS